MLLRTKTLTIFLLTSGSFFAQSNTLSTGGNASGTNGSVSYSIGQIDYTSQSGTNGQLNQGVQQPYEFFTTNSVNEIGDLISLSIGPNPATDELNITFQGNDNLEMTCMLFDVNGKELINPFELTQNASLDMKNYPIGIYNLVIRSGNQDIKTFKIIKN